MGAMILDYLLIILPEMGIDPFKRLFNFVVHEKDEQPERFKEINVPVSRRDPGIYTRLKKSFGFATSASGVTSRTNLYSDILKFATSKAADKVYDKALIDQITGLITKNGRIDHEDGEHDDLVIGWLLAMWLIIRGMNLSFYGIESTMKMIQANEVKALSHEEIIFYQSQAMYRQQLQDLNDKLIKTNDDYISMKIEQEMRQLMTRLVIQEDEVLSVDELIRSAREKRKNNKMFRHANVQQNSMFGQYQIPQSQGHFYRGN